MYKRIRIVGGPGSGKSYLGKKLSKAWNLPLISTDDMHFTDDDIDFTKHRTEKERIKMMKDFCNKKQWIIEGSSTSPWSQISFNKADLIIFLNVPRWKQIFRITRRSLFEKNKKKETFFGWLQLVRWCWIWPQKFRKSEVSKMEYAEFNLADDAYKSLIKTT